ncbi:MAG TPA: NUDIX hydrolase [Balneolaceae bacterium]|nr:NUDIX hydrolase [Balneolaceae bacterium]|tara:strand:+ start:126721 stop:127185 length:465 start_codon:yes stop_codon:yes gene_type:complete
MTSDIYSGKIRIRVCGLLFREGRLLLVKLHSPVTNKDLWIPPGGGLEFGESLHTALKREFKEETGLTIKVGELLHINEMIKAPYHALEFYFNVDLIEGKLTLGYDPEHSPNDQLLKDIRYFSPDELSGIECAPDYIKQEFRKKPGNTIVTRWAD